MPRTWSRTSNPPIVCTFRRSSSAVAGATPACSWSIDRIRPSMNAVVGGLPRSWQTRAEHDRDLLRRGRDRRCACAPGRSTISVCTQTSPSGCHSGSCGQPTSACSSGNSRAMTPRSQREPQADRRTSREEQQLLDLAPDALGRQIVERNACGTARLSPRPSRTRSAPRTARPRSTRRLSSPNVARIDQRAGAGAQQVARGRRTDRCTRRSADPRRSR